MRRAAVVIVLAAVLAAEARGQADDRAAGLTLAFDRDGTGWIGLTVADPPGGRLNVAVVSRGLIYAVPADWSNVHPRQAGAGGGWWPPPMPPPPEKRAVSPPCLAPL